jgi:hypothetical protein
MACIEPNKTNVRLLLEASAVISFASGEFVVSNPGFVPDFVFSSGMATSSGHVWLTDNEDKTIDRVGWGLAVNPESNAALAHGSGETLSRNYLETFADTDDNSLDFSSLPIINPITSGMYEEEVIVDLCTNIDEIQVDLPAGYLLDEDGLCQKDFCPNIEDLQLVAPEGYEKKLGLEDCEMIPLEDSVLFITELLANAPSADGGKEFIEIYNPNEKTVDLKGYVLQVGPSFTKEYVINSGQIKPKEYIVFSDTESKIVLPNTSGVQLRIVAPAGNIVSQTPAYSNAGDDVSWALVEDQWIYTNQITPASPNQPYVEPAVDEVIGTTTILAPCPAGKFRNPSTNRCKTIETAVSALKPCDEDEYRNPETNRCRKVAVASALSACPEGQERNPETNRCRKVSVLGASTDELPTITDVAVENTSGQINWPVILVALFGTFGYIIYEWRSELRQKINFLRLSFNK